MPQYPHLRHKVVLVTGAAGGLGAALTRRLSENGCTVIALDKNPQVLNEMADHVLAETGQEPVIYPMDLLGATPDDFARLAESIGDNLQQLDGLVHTAVAFSGLTPFEHYEPTRWLKEIQVNLTSPAFLTQALLPLLKASQGTLLFTGEDPGLPHKAYWGAYGVSKAANAALADMLAEELESSGVKVETITPPPMHTRHRAKAWPAEDPAHLANPLDVAETYLQKLNR
jgi:NAD(P)-dependent dehydrogenase (short-subunit alcohol dehydrogenase family)